MTDPDSPLDRRAPVPTATTSAGEANVLRHYVAVFRRRWMWVVLGVVLGLLGGFIATLFYQTTVPSESFYKATHTLIVGGDASAEGFTANLSQVAFLVRSQDVLDQVAAKTGLDASIVDERVNVLARGDVMALDVTAVSTDPDEAVALADNTAEALNSYITADSQEQFDARLAGLQEELDALIGQRDALVQRAAAGGADADLANAELASVLNQYSLKYEEFQLLAGEGGPTGAMSTLQSASPVQINATAYAARVVEAQNARGSASVAGTPGLATFGNETNLGTAPPLSKPSRMLLGLAAGLVMGLATALLVEVWDDRVRKRERVESLTGFTVIAEIPKHSRSQGQQFDIAAIDAPLSRAAERYRSIRTAVQFTLAPSIGGDTPAPVLMVTSPNPGEGKTTTVANLAAVLGESGLRTTVIDGDYRKPSVARYLAPRLDPAHPEAPAPTRLTQVAFVPAPRTGGTPAETIARLRATIAEWREHSDIVLLDTPPMLTTNDAVDLLPGCDAVVLVLRAGQTRSGPAERIANVLGRYGVDVLGVVLNGCDDSELDAYEGYHYGYTTGGDEPRSRRRHRGSNDQAEAAPVDDPAATGTAPRA